MSLKRLVYASTVCLLDRVITVYYSSAIITGLFVDIGWWYASVGDVPKPQQCPPGGECAVDPAEPVRCCHQTGKTCCTKICGKKT